MVGPSGSPLPGDVEAVANVLSIMERCGIPDDGRPRESLPLIHVHPRSYERRASAMMGNNIVEMRLEILRMHELTIYEGISNDSLIKLAL